MTIEENLAMALRRGEPLRLRRGTCKSRRELFRERLKLLGLGLEDRLTSRVGLLSGGQRQALTVLMATIASPKLLLLDEHTAALDPKTAGVVLDLTTRIIAEGRLNPHGDPQHGAGPDLGHADDYEARGKDHPRHQRPREGEGDGAGPAKMFEQASGRALSTDRILLTR